MTNKPDTLPEGRGGAGASVPDRASQASPGAAKASPPFGDYPSRWKCEECDAIVEERAFLRAPNPFDSRDELLGCPVCLEVNSFFRACDIPTCRNASSSGQPTEDGGYTCRCWDHSPRNPAYDASRIEARSDETPPAAQPEGREHDPKGDAQPQPQSLLNQEKPK